MKIFIGLGNPGKRYAETRHNAGFKVIDRLAEILQIRLRLYRHLYWIAKGESFGEQVSLVKPATFMNESGRAVSYILAKNGLPPEDCIVVVDDLNIPVGTIKIKKKGSAGGHNGLASIISALGTNEFPRVKVGIGPLHYPEEDLVSFVLSDFSRREKESILNAYDEAAQACIEIVRSGIERAMTAFNTRSPE
ncbi:MAG: aminoacyl-tRNA hydrolase [Candidatus Ratteibacteria bacterium]